MPRRRPALSRGDCTDASHSSAASSSRRRLRHRVTESWSPQSSLELEEVGGRSETRGDAMTSTCMVSTGPEYRRCASIRQCNWFQSRSVARPFSLLWSTRISAARRYRYSRRCPAAGRRRRNNSPEGSTGSFQGRGPTPSSLMHPVHPVLWPVMRSVTSSSMVGDMPNEEPPTTPESLSMTSTTRSDAASSARKLRIVACSTRCLW